jgi:hypothetical protein
MSSVFTYSWQMDASNSRDRAEIISVPENYVVEERSIDGRRVRYASYLRACNSVRCIANSSAERTSSQPPNAQFLVSNLLEDRNSAVGTVTSYKLDDRGIFVRLLARARNFYLLPNVQTGYGAYPASYSIGTGRYFPGNKQPWCGVEHSTAVYCLA